MDNDVKVEEVYESAEAGPVRNQPYNGGRSRHNLTEVLRIQLIYVELNYLENCSLRNMRTYIYFESSFSIS